MWMILYGIFGKVGAFFTSIPQPVLGGMTTFLFANMTVSGIKVMTSEPVDRRERFILAVSAAFGLGTTLVPDLFSSNLLNCSKSRILVFRGCVPRHKSPFPPVMPLAV